MESRIEFFIKPGCYTQNGSPTSSENYSTVLTVELNGETYCADAPTTPAEFAHLTPLGLERLRFRLIGVLGDSMMSCLRRVVLKEVDAVRKELIESRRLWPAKDE